LNAQGDATNQEALMNARQYHLLLYYATICTLILTACSAGGEVALGGVRAWIDVPRDRSVLSLKPHQVIAHASDAAGVQIVELLVNSAASITMECDNPGNPLTTCSAMWDPPALGEYRLEVRATNPAGAVGLSAPVYVSIGQTALTWEPFADDTSTPSQTHPSTPSITPPDKSPTPTSTPSTPTLTPTLIAPSPTSTFTSTPTKPPKPPTPDTFGPPKPYVIGPKENEIVDCPDPDGVILQWQEPSDPSGIASYWVELFISYDSGGNWNLVKSWETITSTQLDVDDQTDCGNMYVWKVSARDGAGNLGAYELSQFRTGLP
jgi:hypothetical protein